MGKKDDLMDALMALEDDIEEDNEELESSVNDDDESNQTHIETVTNIDTQDSSVIKVQEDKQSLGNDDGTIESSSSPSTTAEGDIDNIFAGGTTTQDDNMIDANKD